MTRLNSKTLSNLSDEVACPTYDRQALSQGIVHLGVGAFHRAHQAVYCDDVLAAGDPRWGIKGVSLRSPDMRDALDPQDGLYTMCVRSGEGDQVRVIGSLGDILVAPEDPQRVVAAIAAPETRIVSMTVTEKGYCHDPASGDLADTHPDIVHDLQNPNQPKSMPGFLVEAIRRRRDLGLPQATILSCDNLPSNGKTAKKILTQFAMLRDPDLGKFVEDEISCPSTMVDRIVPATTEADRETIDAILGVRDAWPVVGEPFTQWVVEDAFTNGRPGWDAHGVQFVSDVEPYELMKLRLLNGAHSAIAYLGYLAGLETVSDAVKVPAMATYVRGLMDREATPTLPILSDIDLEAYKSALLERFANPALQHRTWQIAMDGSQKLPQRLLGTIRDRLATNQPFGLAALAVAGWMRYATGQDEAGQAIDVRDPLSPSFHDIYNRVGSEPSVLVREFTKIRGIFGDDLPKDAQFVQAVTNALEGLMENGAARSVEQAAALLESSH